MITDDGYLLYHASPLLARPDARRAIFFPVRAETRPCPLHTCPFSDSPSSTEFAVTLRPVIRHYFAVTIRCAMPMPTMRIMGKDDNSEAVGDGEAAMRDDEVFATRRDC